MIALRKDTLSLINKCADDGLSQKEACDLLDMKQATLSKISKRYNIDFINHRTKLKDKRNADKGMLPICDAAYQAERGSAEGSERPREEEQGVLPIYDGRAVSNSEQPRTPPFAYATLDQTKEAMRDQPREIKYEIMYSHLLHAFEKKQIKRGLRDPINNSSRPRQVITNKATHKNFVSDNDVRQIRAFSQKDNDKIFKCINRGGRYTTTMISKSTGLSVSALAWRLNVMFKDKLVDRVSKNTTPIIGNAGAKSWRYVYFKK